MSTRGRKPKPTALKLINGNPGKRRINHNEPAPERCLPPCPAYLDARAAKHWDDVAPLTFECGILTPLDVDALARYCQAFSDRLEAIEEIQSQGAVLTLPNKPYRYLNPWVTIKRYAEKTLDTIGSDFGFTPSARTRIRITLPHSATNSRKSSLLKRPD